MSKRKSKKEQSCTKERLIKDSGKKETDLVNLAMSVMSKRTLSVS